MKLLYIERIKPVVIIIIIIIIMIITIIIIIIQETASQVCKLYLDYADKGF